MKRITKKFTAFLFATLVAMQAVLCASAYTISFDGEKYSQSAPSLRENGATYVSARALIDMREQTNAAWDGSEAVFESDTLTLRARVGDGHISANGEVISLGGGRVKLIDDRVTVPIRALAHALGADVHYNEKTDDISLKTVRAYVGRQKAYSDEDLYWMSRIICAESCDEPYIGKLLVGDVVMNRVASTAFPNTVKDVIFDKKYSVQFTPVSNGTVYKTPCTDCETAAKAVLSGAVRSNAAMYFVNTEKVPVSWVSENRPMLFKYGGHTFFE